eukprot:COSAG03_NODE_13964_length_482_cov_0.464752_1_plen_55_part_10
MLSNALKSGMTMTLCSNTRAESDSDSCSNYAAQRRAQLTIQAAMASMKGGQLASR